MKTCTMCPNELSGRQTLYCSNACKSASWKGKTGYVVQGRFERCQTPKGRRSGPSGLQVSYPKAVEAVAAIIPMNIRATEAGRKRYAESILRDALSDKQRARLDARQ